jgi:15-cis-phytoene synthase
LDERERDAAIRAIAREGDPDRYLSALFAPADARSDLFTLYAFNVELARIAEQVSEPGLGEIRLQWWRDAIPRAAAGEPTGHPVADALGDAMRRRDLSPEAVAGLIDARQFDISVKLMPNRATLDSYLADTAGALFLLAAEIVGDRAKAGLPPKTASAAKSAGVAYGLTGLMRALPVHAARGRIDLPADMLLHRGTSQVEVAQGKTTEGLKQVLAELRRSARASLREALTCLEPLSAREGAAFLPLALVAPYLRALAKGDPLHRIADINPLYRLWRLGTWRFR